MNKLKPWCWQPAQTDKGPDWLLLAYVTRASEQTLAQAIANTALEGYTAFANTLEYCPIHQQMCAFHSFIDSTNAQTYQHNLSSQTPHNIWIYNSVQSHANLVRVESGYGGRGATYNQTETAFLLHLFNTPGITLDAWQVLAGGNGYDYALIHEGTGVESFAAYLTAH